MFFRALACDYDGTLAIHDRIPPAGVAALERARGAGLRLILVTGRTFFELTRVCERLDLFDTVVAENGALLYSPATGAIREQAPPPPPRLLAELDRRGIDYQLGHVIVGVARADEGRVREALAAAETSLDLIYNRAALMLLPAGLGKGSGVSHAIRELRLSPHDVLAMGDAENDLDLFEACGWAACPAHAVPPVRDRADWVFPGPEAEGIAAAIDGPILGDRLPVAESPRHQIPLGWSAASAEAVTCPERGVNVLIHGEPLSGKSWLAGALVERLIARRYAVAVIDPEGDYAVLGGLPGVRREEIRSAKVQTVDGALGPFDHDPAACVVMDLSRLPHRRKLEVIELALRSIRRRRERLGLPHWVVLDEAHYALHDEGVVAQAVGIESRGFCLVTYKPSWLRESVLKALDVLLLARTAAPEERAFLRAFIGEPADESGGALAVLERLPRGEFLALRRDDGDRWPAVTFAPAPRETPHVRHLRKYAESPVPSDRRFDFRYADGRPAGAADSLKAFCEAVRTVPEEVLASHAVRGDFSRWVLDVFLDPVLAQSVRKTEARFARGEIRDLRGVIHELVELRYGREP